MTTETIKVYSQTQYDKIVEFQRADAIVRYCKSKEEDLWMGHGVILTDLIRGGPSRSIDQFDVHMFVGALVGMFTEMLELGLYNEVLEINRGENGRKIIK